MWIRSGDICDQSGRLAKIVLNFGRFLPSKILLGAPLPKSNVHISTPASTQALGKVMWGYSHHPKVIVINMLNFKPNFKCLPLKFFGRPRPSLWCASASLGECLAHVKIWGASTLGQKYGLSKKVDLGGYKLTCPTFWIVEQSSPDFFRRMREKSFSITSFQFWVSCLIPEIFTIKVGSCEK